MPEAFKSDFSEKQAAFAEFIAQHGRSYASLDHAEERFQVFSQNYDNIKAHNAKGTFEKGVNAYADLTSIELEQMLHQPNRLRVPRREKKLTSSPLINLEKEDDSFDFLPDEVSWKDKKVYQNRNID